jgi:tRNA C32,U32 (ribose-2'-O)-methylase TrmJ
MAVPRLPWVPEALPRGNTLRHPACVHWTGRDACHWLGEQRSAGTRIIGVELTEEAIRLADLPAARQRTIAVLGNEQTGIPAEGLDPVDMAVEIPMIGTGASLNVAVAGSLVLYRLAGSMLRLPQDPQRRRTLPPHNDTSRTSQRQASEDSEMHDRAHSHSLKMSSQQVDTERWRVTPGCW